VHRESLVLVTPALADANNGNWQTARRWAALLSPAYRVDLRARWPESADQAPVVNSRGGDRQGSAQPVAMVALHARRCAASIAAWRAARPDAPLVVVLTGTDLYRDIDSDADAQRSLQLADVLVVLNERGAQRLPAVLRRKVQVVLQSCPARQTLEDKPTRWLRAVAVGHLREEKDPRTLFDAVRRLGARVGPGGDLRVDHLGRALDPALGTAAQALAADCPGYRWLGGQTHEQARRRIQAAHVLVHMSRMEGGAHVVIEALRSGTPVIASRIDGNVGLLGADYPGYFPPGDAAALARRLECARDDPAWLAALQAAAARRAPLFTAQAERQALLQVLSEARKACVARRRAG
jgi:putative glycosyltransferase (TIGR04348 family)